MFDVPEVGNGEFNDHMEANDAFQQEAITDVVPIDIGDNIQYCRDDVEPELIREYEITEEHRENNENEEHDILDDDMDPDMDYDM